MIALRTAEYQWKQMEWIGFYFEWAGRRILQLSCGGSEGPRYGRTRLDYLRDYPWDLRAHVCGKDKTITWAILNDVEAADRCLEDFRGVGFLIAEGKAGYDDPNRSFQRWHDAVKGEESDYVRRQRSEGARSRRRKVRFEVVGVRAVALQGIEERDKALREGWLTRQFQTGMRNSNDRARRAKYMVYLAAIPGWATP